jgi:hypothetical protein
VPAPSDKKGRRGNWWDQKGAADEEPPPEEAVDPHDVPGATAMLQVEPKPPPPRRRAPPRADPEPVEEPEQPTFQRPKRKQPAEPAHTQMLDIRNAPTPEEIRQQAAKAAKAAEASEPPAEGWSATKVATVLIALAVVLGGIAVALALLLK